MIKRSIFFLTLTLLAFVLGFFFLQSSFFKVKHIEIVSNVSGSLEALKKKLEPLKGELVFKVPLKKVLTQIESDVSVKKAWVLRKWPNKISVKIHSEKPLFLVLNRKTHQMSLVDYRGNLVPQTSVKGDFPILTKSFLSDKVKLQKLIRILSRIPDRGLFSHPEISEIYEHSSKGLVFVLIKSRTRLLLPFDSLLVHKIEQIEDVLQYLYRENIESLLVDTRYSKKIVVKVRT